MLRATLIVVASCGLARGSSPLERLYVQSSVQLDGVAVSPQCNDGSTASLYLSPGNSTCYVIFLQGGEYCSSPEECAARAVSSKDKVSSSTMPVQLEGATVLDADSGANAAYAGCRRVFIPYCSSDLWIGRGGSASSPAGFRFSGAAIFRGAVEDLLRSHGMANATDVTLVGTSAGGVGALNHISWLAARPELEPMARAGRLRLLVDSAWFIDFGFNGSTSRSALFNATDTEVINYWGLQDTQDTQDTHCYNNSRLCFLAASMVLDDKVVPPWVPVLFLSSLYDAYLIQRSPILNQLDQPASILQVRGGAARIRASRPVTAVGRGGRPSCDRASRTHHVRAHARVVQVEMYGGAMRASMLDAMRQRYSLSLFLAPCLQHQYLVGITVDQRSRVSPAADFLEVTYRVDARVWGETSTTGAADSCVVDEANATRCAHVGSGTRASAAAVVAAWAQATPLSGRADTAFADSGGDVSFSPSTSFALGTGKWIARSLYLPECTGVLCETSCPTVFELAPSSSNSNWLTPALRGVGVIWLFTEIFMIALGATVYAFHRRFVAKLRKYCKAAKAAENGSFSSVSAEPAQALPQVEVPVGLAFDNIHYTTTSGAHVIKGVTGYLNPGEMMAVMGPSGSGKTTMLDILASRARAGTLTGDVFVNGRLRKANSATSRFFTVRLPGRPTGVPPVAARAAAARGTATSQAASPFPSS